MPKTLEEIKAWLLASDLERQRVGLPDSGAYKERDIIRDLVARCERAKKFLSPVKGCNCMECAEFKFKAEVDALERGE